MLPLCCWRCSVWPSRDSPLFWLAFIAGTWIVVVFRPQRSMLLPKSDLLACILGLKADKFGTVTSPSLAAAQNAVIRQTRTVCQGQQ